MLCIWVTASLASAVIVRQIDESESSHTEEGTVETEAGEIAIDHQDTHRNPPVYPWTESSAPRQPRAMPDENRKYLHAKVPTGQAMDFEKAVLAEGARMDNEHSEDGWRFWERLMFMKCVDQPDSGTYKTFEIMMKNCPTPVDRASLEDWLSEIADAHEDNLFDKFELVLASVTEDEICKKKFILDDRKHTPEECEENEYVNSWRMNMSDH